MSAKNSSRATRRSSSSGARSTDAGCTVANVCLASGVSRSMPRSLVTRNVEPSSDCAAVAPSTTMMSGTTSESSLASHGRHASTS